MNKNSEFTASNYTERNSNLSDVWTAGIDRSYLRNGQPQIWLHAIQIHHDDELEAEALRDKILAALTVPGGVVFPAKPTPAMVQVLTVMLTSCHSIEESYADLLRAVQYGGWYK